MGLDDLPSEVLFVVGTHLDGSGLARLGMTCRRLCAVTDDDALWERAFECAFMPALYDGVAAGILSTYTHASALMVPFAHARVAGHGWRWLYAAHVRAASAAVDTAHGPLSLPQTFPPPPPLHLAPGTTRWAHYRNGPAQCRDDVDRRRHLVYGVDVARDAWGRAIGWVEALWASDDPSYPVLFLSRGDRAKRFVIDPLEFGAAMERVTAGGSVPAVGDAVRGRVVAVTGRTVYDGACRNGLPDGVGTVTDTHGHVWETQSRAGIALTTSRRPNDGWVDSIEIARAVDPTADPTGTCPLKVSVSVRYTNGDALCIVRGSKDGTAAFWCSPRCDDLAFAGRRIECGAWAHTLDMTAIALFPLDDNEDARLFRAYLAAGHCGWQPNAQQRASAMAAVGATVLSAAPVALFRGSTIGMRHQIGGLVYSIVRPTDAVAPMAAAVLDTFGRRLAIS